MLLTDVVDLRDVGMPQAGGGPGLDLEAADVFRRCQVRGQDHLDGHGAVQGLLPRLVDHAHAAPADFFQELVGTEIAGKALALRIPAYRGRNRRLTAGARPSRASRHFSDAANSGCSRSRACAIRPLACLKLRQVVVQQFQELGIVGRCHFERPVMNAVESQLEKTTKYTKYTKKGTTGRWKTGR